jgi:hypothetical protein
MLHQQTVRFLSKYDRLARFPAPDFCTATSEKAPIGTAKQLFPGFFLTASGLGFAIHLESAVFMFHMKATTLGITGSLRAACSEPVQRFLACPFS